MELTATDGHFAPPAAVMMRRHGIMARPQHVANMRSAQCRPVYRESGVSW